MSSKTTPPIPGPPRVAPEEMSPWLRDRVTQMIERLDNEVDPRAACAHLTTDTAPDIAMSLHDNRLRCTRCDPEPVAKSCARCGAPGPSHLLVCPVEVDCEHDGAPHRMQFIAFGLLCDHCRTRTEAAPS